MIDLVAELRLALTAPDVRAVIADIVADAINTALKGLPMMDDLLDVPAAAKVVSMTPAALQKAALRGTIPAVRIGRRLRFRRRDLLAGRR